MPLHDKVEAIKNIAVPTTKKQLRSDIGLVNTLEICGNIDPKYYLPYQVWLPNKTKKIELKNLLMQLKR